MSSKSNHVIQQRFLQKLKAIIPSNYSLVDELADLLQISTDSAYRRIRGETAVSMDEVVRLCQHYKIPLGLLGADQTDGVTFNYKLVSDHTESFKEYLTKLLADLQKIRSAHPKQVIYAAADVPLFHHFNYPEQAAFKFFYWLNSVSNLPTLEGKSFTPSVIPAELIALGKQVYDVYCDIPSIEIWTEESANSTIKQIDYYWEAGLFEQQADAVLVVEQLAEMLHSIQTMAKQRNKNLANPANSKKNEKENFLLYHSEIQIGNNNILVQVGSTKVNYLRHQTFNYMYTTNTRFCNETEAWMANLISKSILISGVSEKQRYQFFKGIQKNVAKLLTKVKEG
ncbi:hypothetical protein [uncultured Microscilla sp.]|uniref:hypothetical protein n=1 Tax=uncultured Microscilla sp. TaxID=432653 RepID=UPI00262E4DBF|nr:hypothetical protein [uncultured Microscilla sp.]